MRNHPVSTRANRNRTSRALRMFARHPLPLALAAVLAAPLAQAQVPPSPGTLPTGGTVVNGTAAITLPGGGTMNINQTSQGAIINWEGFSIGSDATVNFVQPGATGVTLNRVVGNVDGIPLSQIFGNLNANGRVFIVNPSGVLFGAGSQVNVGGLVASTLAIDDANFLAGVGSGSFTFNATSPGAGSVDNAGTLIATTSGTIALLAGTVNNAGSITADGGTVTLASSQQVTLDFFGDGLTQVTIGLGTDDGGITNSGTLQADGGSVQLRTQTFDGTPGGFGGFISHTGIIRARSLASRNGRVVLDAGAGAVGIGFSDGTTGATIDASGTATGRTGGAIEIRGDSIEIEGETSASAACAAAGNACTRIDASGHSGGGTIDIASGTSLEIRGDSDDGPVGDDSVAILSDALAAGSGGTITLANAGNETEAGAPGGTSIGGAVLLSAQGLGTASGGAIAVTNDAGAIEVRPDVFETFSGTADFIADGVSAGGSVVFDAGTALNFLPPDSTDLFTLSADATGSGAGGLVRTASADLLDLRQIEVSAGGPAGAGAWEIQSGRGLAIVAEPDDEFGPLGGVSLISDESIGNALSAGTDVDIVVPAPADPAATAQINIAPNVAIANTGTLPVALSLTVGRGQVVAGIGADGDPNGPWSITSSGGALDVTMDALSTVSLVEGTLTTAGGAVSLISRDSSTNGVELSGTTVTTDGGDVDISGSATAEGVTIGFSTIDTRVGQSDANAGGAIRISGQAEGVAEIPANAGVSMFFSSLLGSTGAVQIDGQVSGVAEAFVSGVDMFENQVATTLGDILITGAAGSGGTGILLDEGSLSSTAGDIVLSGTGNTGFGVDITNHAIETVTGDIDITGRTVGTFGGEAAGVSVSGGEILSDSGSVGISGTVLAAAGTGVSLSGGGLLSSGTGAIDILGIGGMTDGAVVDGSGILVLGYDILSDGGDIVLSGHGAEDGVDDSGNPILNNGLGVFANSSIVSSGGDILLSGSSAGSGGGILVSGGGGSLPAAEIDAGGGNIVLRAGNDGSTAALQIEGSVASSGVVDLRAGEVTTAGAVLDRNASTLQIGGGAGQFVSMASLANIDAPDLVIGHAGHAGAIAIAETLTRAGNVTLQNTGGAGGVALNAAVNLGSGTLALVSGGDIAQTAAGAITAQSLLARSTGGSVNLTAAQNDVSGNTLAGGAAGDFGYVDINALAISDVTARGFDAAGQAATDLAESGIDAGDAVFVRNNTGDLTLGADVSGTLVDLVTAGRLQNIAGADISAGNRWRVWADTFVGETRGGLAGTGPLPNLYNCSFGGPCGVTVPADGDHFIYRVQPTATIDIASFTREYGLANPALLFTVSGLILGDQAANAIFGAPSTTAAPGSDVGSYPITGSFTSPAGYAVQLNPGNAAITPATLTYVADPFTLLFGGPFGPFTGTVTGFRNGDTLADDTSGTLQFVADADPSSPAGFYPIFGTGLEASNYVFVQDPANLTALRVDFVPPTLVVDPIRETTDTYVYDRNIGTAPMCLVTGPLDGTRQDQAGDALGREWSKVRSRPNLTSCVDSQRKHGCGDF